jgi:hypothetical protein
MVISVSFMPLFFAGLVPYITVGTFFFMIMLFSGVVTLILMPSILQLFYPYLKALGNIALLMRERVY